MIFINYILQNFLIYLNSTYNDLFTLNSELSYRVSENTLWN